MATLVGKVGIVMKGAWSSSATYEVLDAVSYNNSLYIAKQNVPANTLPTNTTYWQLALANPAFTYGTFRTNEIVVGRNLIDVTSYEPYSGTMPTNPNKVVAFIAGFSDNMDEGIILTADGNKLILNATKANAHIHINWIQLNI